MDMIGVVTPEARSVSRGKVTSFDVAIVGRVYICYHK